MRLLIEKRWGDPALEWALFSISCPIPLPDVSLASFVQDEMSNSFSENMGQLLDLPPPVSRPRPLAFLHVVEPPIP